ncbi:hypothetical protein FF38_01246 [Lucilia cuprina]|uniref:Uncharacterized protein n=1 Tax=Lucilia cuprina TaxID=7375 RepID=A0A0L0CHB0_LUCCU|nr:hypothetical protein FF38_01246 [Lucilia cuprina]
MLTLIAIGIVGLSEFLSSKQPKVVQTTRIEMIMQRLDMCCENQLRPLGAVAEAILLVWLSDFKWFSNALGMLFQIRISSHIYTLKTHLLLSFSAYQLHKHNTPVDYTSNHSFDIWDFDTKDEHNFHDHRHYPVDLKFNEVRKICLSTETKFQWRVLMVDVQNNYWVLNVVLRTKTNSTTSVHVCCLEMSFKTQFYNKI